MEKWYQIATPVAIASHNQFHGSLLPLPQRSPTIINQKLHPQEDGVLLLVISY
ncbi:hypothetical protein [Anabaena azotica]|uniref:Uncharacterized protein n=1 Tax=Anabaena azotica FACHB-119 TaxID=947527 RepID=A0ABR8CZR7_9NOST|nr:hypothetical protein [Anabaena azotica]MBD2500342.1 hypothetical protein [Anabaena azotica FACHB-119]